MPYSFETGPDGKIKTIFTGKVYDGPIDPSVVKPKGGGSGNYFIEAAREAQRRGGDPRQPGFILDYADALLRPRTTSRDVIGTGALINPNVAPIAGLALDPTGLLSSGFALTRALTGPKTGDFRKDLKVGMQRYAQTLEAPLFGAQRTVYNAMYPGLLTSVSNLAQGASRRPGQPDSPLFGILPPPPKAKSTGAIEDFLTSTTQWVGAAAATYLGGRALMGIAPVASAVGAISRLPGIAQVAGAPATLRTMASATQGIGGVSGGLRAGAKLLEAAGQGAIPGFVADVVAFTPGERTTASSAIDFAKQNKAAKDTLDWVNNSAPELRPLLQQVVLSSPNDNDITARLKEGILGLGLGAAVGTAIESAALAGRAVMNQWRTASKVQARAAAAAPDVAAAVPTPAGQQTVDVTATAVQPTPAAIAPAAPTPTPAAPAAPRQQARVDVAQQRVDAVTNKLTVLGEAPPKPSTEKRRFGPGGAAGADPAAVAQWKAEKQAYDRWRRQWLKLSKEKTAADNALVAARAEEPAAPAPAPAAAPAPPAAAEPAPAPAAVPAVPASAFEFPPDLATSNPRFGMATVRFGNSFDRAAYMLRDVSRKSKGEERLIAALQKAGFDIAEVRKHGQAVNDALKASVKEQTGSAKAPQETMELDIPAQDFTSTSAAAPDQASIPDPWQELTQAQAATARAVEDAANKLAIAANTVPDPMGPIGSDRRGNWLPTYSQVREENVADIAVDPQQLQYKAEGRGAATGETQALAGAEAYNPVVGGWISAWRNPADNKLYVVNGHNRLALAKRSGIEKIPVWEIQAGSAAEARTIGAIENIASNKGTAIDAATTFHEAGLTIEELQARGVDFNVEIANQGLALSRLPVDVFAKVVDGTLSIDKALALGSQPLLDPVVKSIAKEAAKADVDADQIRATVQQAKEIEAAVINPEVLPPGAEIPVAGASSEPSLADMLGATMRAMAESDARLFRNIESITNLTRKAIDLAGGEVAPVAKGAQKALPATPAKALPDTRGQNVFFHGTSAPIEKLQAESDVPGITAKSGTLETIFQIATTKGQNIYGQGFYTTDDLITASEYQKKGTGSTPVVYQIKENRPDLRFFDLDKEIGKDAIDSLFGEVPGMAREQVYNAVDDGLRGQQYKTLGQALDLIRGKNGALKSQDVFDAIKQYLSDNGYDGFTHQGGKLAGRGKRLHQVRIYWDPAENITIERYTPPAAGAEVPAPGTLEHAAPAIEIPAAAARKIKTPAEEQQAADLLLAWARHGTPPDRVPLKDLDAAINAVRAKGMRLNTDKVPGLNLDKALNDAAMGMATAETDAVRQAYLQFYGVTPSTRPAVAAAVAEPAANVTRVPLVDETTEGTAAPLLTRDVVIPEAASRPLPPNSPRTDSIAQSIAAWLGVSQEEARNLLLVKGQVLDLDKVPGIDVNQAVYDRDVFTHTQGAFGNTPMRQAAARAYEQFYGPSSRQQQITRLSIANAVDKHMPDKLPDALSVAPDVVEAVKKTLLHVVRVYAGPDVVVRFENGIVKRIDYGAHGQAGEMIEVDGGYTVNLDGVMHGDPVKEVIEFSKIATYDYAGQSDVDFFNARTSTAFHEIFHIIQERYLSSRQLQVVDSVMARVKLAMAEINRGGTDAPLERQAQAFEPYMRGVVEGVSPSLTMLGIAPSVQREIAERAATGQGLDKFQAMFGSGFFKAIEILDDLLNFVERVYNAITIKQWSSLRDIYAQSAAGKIQAEGATRGNVFEVSDLPGKVTDFMRYKQGDPEWALRVLELIRQDVAGPGANSPGQIALLRGVKAANEAIAKGLGQGADDAQIIQDLLNESRSSLPARLQATPPPEPPRGIPGVPSPEDPEWQKRFAAVYRENAERLAAGEITREELLMLSHFQKAESPSGRPYTAKSEELAPGLAAMSQVLPDRPTESGIPVMNVADIVKQNQEWFNSHGLNKDAILAGLDSVTRGFAGHEHGALNRAMFYADHLQVAAQVEAGKWLNGGADADLATLNSMIAAADKARRMHKAVMEVTRPWGQLGVEMQMSRDYTVPAIAGEAPPVRPGEPPVQSVVDQQLGRALADGDSRPDGIYEDFTDLVDPALTEALKTGEMTVQAQAAADDIATFLLAGGVDPSLRVKTFERLADIVQSSPGVAGKRINGNSPLIMVMINNMLSSGATLSANLMNGIFRAYQMMGTQALGSAISGDIERSIYALSGIGRMTGQIYNGFRLAAEAFRAGEPLTSTRSYAAGAFDQLAARDASGQLMKQASGTGRSGWTVTSMDMADDFARSTAGKVLNALWQIVGTGASRLQLTIDTFNSTIAGHTYEWFLHMPRGMEIAVENGMEKFSKEAWDYANQYADARLHQSLKGAIINGRTITDAILDSTEAQNFIRSVNMTEDMVVNLQPRSFGEGTRLGMARGLKDQELVDFAKQYVEEGDWRYKLARFAMEGMDMRIGALNLGRTPRFGRTASMLGTAYDKLQDVPMLGAVLKVVSPFMHFGTNAMKALLQATPAAGLTDTFWRDFTSENPAVRQKVNGEIAVATGVATLLVLATQTGRIRINGAGPRDPQLADNWINLQGRIPNSIQYWDDTINSWSRGYPLTMFEPYTTLFGMVGDYNDLSAQVPSATRERLGGAFMMELIKMQMKGQLDKSYFQGVRNLYEAAFDPSVTFTGPGGRDPFARFLARTVATFQPYSSAMRAARRQVDPIRRSVDPSEGAIGPLNFWNELMDEVRNQTPGFSTGLPPHRDWTLPGSPPMMLPQVLGTDIVPESQPFLIGAMQFTPWSAIRVNEPVLDPVKREMGKHFGRGAVFSGPRAADFGSGLRLTPSELSRYQQVFGSVRDEAGKTWHQTVTEIINAPDYNVKGQDEPGPNGEPSFQAMRIQAEISRFKELAKEEFMATPGKGAQITAAVQTRQERQRRFNEQQRYGIPGAPQQASGGTSMTNFIEEMNR